VTTPVGWSDPAQVEGYLHRIGGLEARRAGDQMLVEVLPPRPERVLDLGCGDGRLAALVLESRPSVSDVLAVDFSPPMLERARRRFADDPRVTIREWNLDQPLDPLGGFDVVVSGFAIHHLDDRRKRALFAEVLAALGKSEDDPEDQLVDVETQLAWMRHAGLTQVDCLWRWRGFALLVGLAP
jgi:tRNA (cmo5U34)-methyltransferase